MTAGENSTLSMRERENAVEDFKLETYISPGEDRVNILFGKEFSLC